MKPKQNFTKKKSDDSKSLFEVCRIKFNLNSEDDINNAEYDNFIEFHE